MAGPSSECVKSMYTFVDVALERQRMEEEEKNKWRKILAMTIGMYECALRAEMETELQKEREENEKLKRLWVRPWIERRGALGGEVLMRELAVEDPKTYTNAFRMNSELFNELLSLIEPTIQRRDTVMRPALNARLKLEITLRYLASGDSFKSLSLLFRVPPCTISKFLPEVLSAISDALQQYLKVPTTTEEWTKIARHFAQVWNFHKCVGAIDGKHVNIKAPPKSGSNYYNYKGYFSTVLLAVVDGDYNFLYVNIGANGRCNDAGIFKTSALAAALESNSLNLPDDHVILGDSAFPLKPYLMKPYGFRNGSKKQTIFNYRLSRARRIVENAFGILAWRFRVFSRPIELKVSTVDEVVRAACTLHNWLRARSPTYITAGVVDEEDANTGEIIPGQWRAEITELPSARPSNVNNYTQHAKRIRDGYAEYFWECGAISQQWKATGIVPGNSDVIVYESDFEEDMDDEEP